MEEEDLTFKIRGCVYEVFRILGAGFVEHVYQQALLHELELQGLRAERQRVLELSYKGKSVWTIRRGYPGRGTDRARAEGRRDLGESA